MNVLILEMKGTSVGFIRMSTVRVCSGSLLQHPGVSLLTDQMRSGTYWVQAD